MICRTYDAEGKCLTICHDLATALADNERLRGLLLETRLSFHAPGLRERIEAVLADQPTDERRPCTCPDGERPIPCPRKFAVRECQAAAGWLDAAQEKP